MKGILVLAMAGTVISTMAFADDGSCGNFSPTTTTELKVCMELAKGATNPDARIAGKLIESGDYSWSATGEGGTCRMTVTTRGVLDGNSHNVRASCGVSDPKGLKKCVEDARYGSDVAQCGLKHITR